MKLILIVLALFVVISRGSRFAQSKNTPLERGPHDRALGLRIRGLWKALEYVSATLAAALLLIAGISQTWGPPWSVFPDISPSPPDQSQAFSLPFLVKNRSSLFSITNAQFSCRIVSAITDADVSLTDDFTVGSGPMSFAKDASFRCYFPFSMAGVLKEAKIYIYVEKRGGLFDIGRPSTQSYEFNWDAKANPPRWLPGPMID